MLCFSCAFLSNLSGKLAAAAPVTAPVDIVAKSAVVLDAESGRILYSKEATIPWAPASLTKLATALTAVDLAPLDTVLRVSTVDLVGETSMGLRAGDAVTLETALYGLLLASDNDAAMVIARNLSALPGESPDVSVQRFVRQMNALVQRLGLENTTFRNPHGLDEEGHVSTAYDLALLMRVVLQRPELRQILSTPTYEDEKHIFRSTNRLLGVYPGLIGGKTGITEAGGYSLIEAAERDGRTIIVVVLGSTAEAWYDNAVHLLDYGFAQLAQSEGLPAGSTTFPEGMREKDTQAAQGARSGHEALILQVPKESATIQPWWFWPASAVTVVVALGIVASSLPVIAALVALRRHRKVRQPRHSSLQRQLGRNAGRGDLVRPRSRAPMKRFPASSLETDLKVHERNPSSEHSAMVHFDPAFMLAQRAVRAARRGDSAGAEDLFLEVLRLNPVYELTKTPAFWSMSAAGVLAAARAYCRVGRTRDAQILLAVAELSFGPLPLLRGALEDLSRQGVLSTRQSGPSGLPQS